MFGGISMQCLNANSDDIRPDTPIVAVAYVVLQDSALKHCNLRVVAVSLGMLCLMLLAVITGISVHCEYSMSLNYLITLSYTIGNTWPNKGVQTNLFVLIIG